MPETMRAIRLSGPVDIDGLTVSDVPIPEVRPGWVRIRVMAFGVNESEVTSRKGESGPDFSFPRILGIEAVGLVDAVGEGVDLTPGQKVATMMGGLGRTIDGSYAEYTLVDAANVIPFDTDVVQPPGGWARLCHGRRALQAVACLIGKKSARPAPLRGLYGQRESWASTGAAAAWFCNLPNRNDRSP